MATSAIMGIGTLLQIGDGGGPEVFTTVAEVISISGPNETRETLDVTHMNSPNNTREKFLALKDSGSVTFDMNFLGTNTQQNQLKTDMDAGILRNFKIIMPGTVRTFDFAALVTELSREFPVDSQITASVTLEISGPVTES